MDQQDMQKIEPVPEMTPITGTEELGAKGAFSLPELENARETVELWKEVDDCFPYRGNRLKQAIQRFFRRLMLFAYHTNTVHQNYFNFHVFRAVDQTTNYIRQMEEKQIRRLPEEIALLSRKIEGQDLLIARQQKEIEELKKQLQILQDRGEGGRS